jgi:hypothetical protein
MGPAERRIGHRRRLAREIQWDIDQRRRMLRRKPARAIVEELSVAGALIRVPTSADPRRGRQVVIGVGPARALVQVRRVSATDDPAFARCGVLFLSMDDGFSAFVNDHSTASPAWVDWH